MMIEIASVGGRMKEEAVDVKRIRELESPTSPRCAASSSKMREPTHGRFNPHASASRARSPAGARN